METLGSALWPPSSRSALILPRTKAPAWPPSWMPSVRGGIPLRSTPAKPKLGEAQAYRMLYAHLDAEQQATYDVLIAAGALPDTREEG